MPIITIGAGPLVGADAARVATMQQERVASPSQQRYLSTNAQQSKCSSSLSDKLEALRSLIPSPNREKKANQLFQETAGYIVLLKTQVLILQ
ncbi:hypothetical protein NMG60_11028489 [Bertholletia excelsa]